jgi:hypothetical protein
MKPLGNISLVWSLQAKADVKGKTNKEFAASGHMEASAKNAAFSLRAETATNRDENDPGMRVSQAMTRDAYIAGQQVG